MLRAAFLISTILMGTMSSAAFAQTQGSLRAYAFDDLVLRQYGRSPKSTAANARFDFVFQNKAPRAVRSVAVQCSFIGSDKANISGRTATIVQKLPPNSIRTVKDVSFGDAPDKAKSVSCGVSAVAFE